MVKEGLEYDHVFDWCFSPLQASPSALFTVSSFDEIRIADKSRPQTEVAYSEKQVKSIDEDKSREEVQDVNEEDDDEEEGKEKEE